MASSLQSAWKLLMLLLHDTETAAPSGTSSTDPKALSIGLPSYPRAPGKCGNSTDAMYPPPPSSPTLATILITPKDGHVHHAIVMLMEHVAGCTGRRHGALEWPLAGGHKEWSSVGG
uniref:Secreted protein n=1 Tax=Oryza sativa subsp. japonica TaxID=39947 RepID=Q69S48_ORYSJ|nr:hypothetical protein [Oryza sativa Japonica Group]